MIQEIWQMETVPDPGAFNERLDWLKQCADAHKKDPLVLDAYGAQPETGDDVEFNKAYLVLEFESLSTRTEYYSKGMSEEVMAVWAGRSKEFVTGKWGHHYLHVTK